MNPKIEKLRAEEERNEQELERLRHQEQRLRNRISYYESGDRKKRAHRLITRGAAILAGGQAPAGARLLCPHGTDTHAPR